MAGPEDQADQRTGLQQGAAGDPRRPGGAMYGQTKRKGCFAAEDQVRAVENFARPGLFEEDPGDPEACQGRDAGRQQQLDAGKAAGQTEATRASKGKGGGESATEAWDDWSGPQKYPEEAPAAGQAKDRSGEYFWDGVPPGSEKIAGINAYGMDPSRGGVEEGGQDLSHRLLATRQG
eukprot:6489965-Heterocapsa_arctica.AAC.1